MDWEKFLAGYEVAVDWPACAFYEELMEAFPGAPVILTVREPGPWYESMRATIYQLRKLTNGPVLVRAAFTLAGVFARGPAGVVRLADRLVWEDTFGGRFEDESYAREVFAANNAAVRRRVPAERLLVFNVREGWGPLCEFLGVEVPRQAVSSSQRCREDAAPALRPRRPLDPGPGDRGSGDCRRAGSPGPAYRKTFEVR